MLHLICDYILSMYCQSCYSVCKPDIDLVLDVHPVERPARAYRNTFRAPRGRCLDPHVQVFLLDEHLGQGRYPILPASFLLCHFHPLDALVWDNLSSFFNSKNAKNVDNCSSCQLSALPLPSYRRIGVG